MCLICTTTIFKVKSLDSTSPDQITVYRVILALQYLQTVSPHRKYTQTRLLTKEITWDIGIHYTVNLSFEEVDKFSITLSN